MAVALIGDTLSYSQKKQNCSFFVFLRQKLEKHQHCFKEKCAFLSIFVLGLMSSILNGRDLIITR